MDYKSFKTVIADISKEKKEKEEALKLNSDKDDKAIEIDISMVWICSFNSVS